MSRNLFAFLLMLPLAGCDYTTPLPTTPVTGGVAAALGAGTAAGGFTVVSASTDHSCALTASGAAYCWGNNSYGQLGTGLIGGGLVPQLVAGNLAFRSISAGTTHTCAVTTTNRGFCWGSDSEGQLGGMATATCTSGACAFAPVPVNGGRSWRVIDAGAVHTCGLDVNGKAFCWGNNAYGAVGDGTTAVRRYNPVAVLGTPAYSEITAGTTHSCAVAIGGTAFCWGENRFGQLGTASTELCASLPCSRTPLPVSGGHTFSKIDAGGLHSCGISASQVAFCWGRNRFLQLGDGTTSDRPVPNPVGGSLRFVALSAGFQHTCAIDTSGAAYCWGAGPRLGNGGATPNHGLPMFVAGGMSWLSISAGGEHSCGVVTASDAYCWGHEDYGELGDGGLRQSTVLVPVLVAAAAVPPNDQPPVARFFVVGCSGRACTFNASISTDDAGIVRYDWTLGDGTTASGLIASHLFPTSGAYVVTLTVTDTAGQTNSTSQKVTVF